MTRPCALDLWVAPDGHGTPTLWHRGDPPDHPQPVDPVAAVAAMLAEVERLTAERDALRAAVERVRCAVESMRFDIDEHARNYGVADQRFRDGLSHGWAKFIDLRAALAPADADAAS